jgi:hypothetical protein
MFPAVDVNAALARLEEVRVPPRRTTPQHYTAAPFASVGAVLRR